MVGKNINNFNLKASPVPKQKINFEQFLLSTKFVLNSFKSPKIKNQPLVTIIIPTFNWSSALRQTIISILNQNYKNFELLVIGDKCTDDSEEIVNTFKDKRIKWFNLEKNFGSQFGPNNFGLDIAKGKYVAYINHDDIWLKNHLSWTVYLLEKYESGLATSNCFAFGPIGTNIFRITNHKIDKMNGSWTPPSSIVHRLDLVKDIGKWKSFTETKIPIDTEFISRFFVKGYGIVKVPTITVVKFPAAWKINSYLTKTAEQQELLNQRLLKDKLYIFKQIFRFWISRRKGNVEYNTHSALNIYSNIKDKDQEFVNYNRKIKGLPKIDV